MLSNTRWQFIPLLIAIIGFPLFLSLDKLPVFLYDEARLAVNSFEMYKTGFSVVTTFNYEPESWNTKPPLLIWMQVISFKLFGLHEITLRLPSVLSAIATCLLIFWFCNKQLKRPWLGILAVVMLITSKGYMNYHHSARTGDYDALLTFFTTSYLLLFFTYLENEKNKYLLLCFLAITGAALTKGIAGLLLAPGLLAYTLYKRRLVYILKQPSTYIGFLFFATVIISYYLLREHYQPGYLELVNANELGGRYLEVGTNTNKSLEDPFFYIHLLNFNFMNWYWLLPPAIIISAFLKKGTYRTAIFFLSVSSVLFLAIISKATGKNDWYDMPVYPLLSIIAASFIINLYELIIERTNANKRKVTIISIIVVIVFVAYPYYKIIKTVNAPNPGNWIAENVSITKYLKDILHGNTALRNFTIVKNKEYEANVDWYSSVLNEKGYNTKVLIINVDKTEYPELQIGDTIITYRADIRQFLGNYFITKDRQFDDRIFIHQLYGKTKPHADSTIHSSTCIQ